jgi:CP family cyanate transporter-like MFS transporter
MAQASRVPYLILSAAFVLGFFVFDSLFVVSPMIPFIMNDFSLSFSSAGLLFSVPIGLLVVTSFFAGVLTDKLGVRKTAGIGAILLAIGSPARAISQNFLTLLLFTSLLGATYGFLLPSFTKMASGWFPPRMLGKVTSVYVSGFYLGGAFGTSAAIPLLFPLTSSWRGTVLVTGAISVVAAILWWLLAKEPPERLDVEKKVVHVERSAWLNRTTIFLAVIMTIENVHFYALGTWLPTFLTEKGAGTASGLIGSLLLYAAIPANFLLPILSDSIGRRKPIVWIGAIINGGAFVLLAPSSVLLLPVLVSTLGVTLVCFFTMIFIVAPEAFEYNALGRAMGFIVSVGFAGGVVGPYTAGLIRDLTGSFANLFIIEAALSLIVAFLAFGLPETGRRRATKDAEA